MAEFDKRLIPNHIFAGATIAVFLFAVVFSLTNAETLITVATSIDDPQTALVLGGAGGSIITALLLNVRDIYQFFFRKTPTTS